MVFFSIFLFCSYKCLNITQVIHSQKKKEKNISFTAPISSIVRFLTLFSNICLDLCTTMFISIQIWKGRPCDTKQVKCDAWHYKMNTYCTYIRLPQFSEFFWRLEREGDYLWPLPAVLSAGLVCQHSNMSNKMTFLVMSNPNTIHYAVKEALIYNLDCLPRQTLKWKVHFLLLVLKFANLSAQGSPKGTGFLFRSYNQNLTKTPK